MSTKKGTKSRHSQQGNARPAAPDLLLRLQAGLAQYQGGQLPQAAATFLDILEKHPQTFDALHLLGLVYLELRQYEQSVACIREALRINPGVADAHYNLGNVFLDMGRPQDAIACFRNTLQLRADYALAYSNLGTAYKQLGQFDEAQSSYRKALALQPDSALTHNNLGEVLHELQRYEEAIASFQKALQLQPVYANAQNNLGRALHGLKRFDEAIACYRNALQVQPDYAEAHYNLGIALQAVPDIEGSIASYRNALAFKPVYLKAHSNLIFALDLSISADTRMLQDERKRWDAIHAAPLMPAQAAHANHPDPERRLRVGYVSADFNDHSATAVFGAALLHFDRSRFDVYAYSNSDKEDAVTGLFQQNISAFRNIARLSDDNAADLIRQDQIDILVDLSGHSSGNRLLVFARKPAPLQITAWGYATSTGMRSVDVFFADPVVVPPAEKDLFAERVRYLPNVVSYFRYRALPEVGALPALSAGHITFGSFNRLVKMSEQTLALWARVLLAIPRSRLMLKTPELDDPASRQRIAGYLNAAGVAPDRITMLGKTMWQEHMATYNQVDIALDPFPHSGGVTTLEGLMMGVPVVTLRWPTIVGRLSASFLTTLNLSDWIAETEEQYIAIAVQKADDMQALKTLRERLPNMLTTSIIGDAAAYMKAVESEYRNLWREWCLRQAQRSAEN